MSLPESVSKDSFDDFIRSIEQRTAERERIGEYEHLIYFILQSRRFTSQPGIEPALSAREFVQRLSSEERARFLSGNLRDAQAAEKIPESVRGRIRDFIQALDKPASDERLAYFKALLKSGKSPPDSLSQALYSDYASAMRFLYRKEFLAKEVAASEKGPFLASLYQDRGHSTDTGIEANFAVWTALSVLKRLNPTLAFNRVLIVGPGLDFAPRTDWLDAIPPESYQPYAVADALLALGLSTPERLEIHCVDINDRVIQFLNDFSKRNLRKLTVLSSLPNTRRNVPADYRTYFANLGKHIGAEVPVPKSLAAGNIYLKKSLLVRGDVAEAITAEKMNILTERYDPLPRYDLVVVTNVFVYFNKAELALSLSNIQSMLKSGGYLIHNELRPELERLSIMLGLEPIQARTLRLSGGDEHPLLDGFVIHRKRL